MFTNDMYFIYVYKQDPAFNNLHRLICRKTQPTNVHVIEHFKNILQFNYSKTHTYTRTLTHTHTHIYIYIYIVVKLATVVEGNLKALFSIATTPKCREGCYSTLSLVHT